MILGQFHRGFRLIQASACSTGITQRRFVKLKEITRALSCDEAGSTSTVSFGERQRACRPAKSAEIGRGAEPFPELQE